MVRNWPDTQPPGPPSEGRGASGPDNSAATPQAEGRAIEDFGEKIGGARKDTAQPLGARIKAATEESAEPGWRKRFKVYEIAASTNENEVGQWAVSDTRVKGWRSGKIGGQLFATKEAAEKAIPLLAVAQKHRAVPVGKVENGIQPYEIWRDVTDRKRVKVVDQQFATRDAALRYMAEHAVDIIETKTGFGEEILAKPDVVKRTGVDRRTGPATTKMFTDAFGFRAVEFGLWNNQDERQEVMNHAYDGLLDLADVLNLPAKALSLNGELALAFGARGQGLSGAKAHYETDYGVINLTKMTGAGSLAHEWLHAADHYFARQDTKAKSEKVRNARGDLVYPDATDRINMASHGFRAVGSQVRPELQKAYTDLIQTMFTKAEQYVEDTQRAEKFVGAAREGLAKGLKEIRDGLLRGPEQLTYMKRNNKPASAEQLATFDQLADKLISGQDVATAYRPSPESAGKRIGSPGWMAGRRTNDTLEGISAILKAVRGRNGFTSKSDGVLDGLRYLTKNYSERIAMLESANANETKTKRVPTSYAMENKKIDQGRASDYWTTEHEMAARAFSAYVEDKVAEQGNQSDFLAYGSDNKFYRLFNIRPFPEGTERVAINQAFDKFIGEIKTKETDAGTAMFSRAATAGESIAARDLQAVIDTAKRNFSNLPKIVTLESPEDGPASLKAAMEGVEAADMIEAAVHNGAIYLFRSRIRSIERAEHVLLSHELRHYGLRGTLGPNLDPALRKLYLANKTLRVRADAIRKQHNLSSLVEATEEALVETTDSELVNLKGWRGFVLAIRDALRSIGFDSLADAIDLAMADQISSMQITEILRTAEEWVRSGRKAPTEWMSGTRFGDTAASRDGGANQTDVPRDRTNIETATRRMGRFVDEYAAGKLKDNDTQILGPTPTVLQALGAEPLNLQIDGATVRKVLAGKHSYMMTPELMKQLPASIYDPLMVFNSPSDGINGKMLLTELRDKLGNPVIVAVHLSKAAGWMRIKNIASAYGMENAASRLMGRRAVQLEYYRNEESLAPSSTPGQLNLPDVVQAARDSGAILKTEADVVKQYGPAFSRPNQASDIPVDSRSVVASLLNDFGGNAQNAADFAEIKARQTSSETMKAKYLQAAQELRAGTTPFSRSGETTAPEAARDAVQGGAGQISRIQQSRPIANFVAALFKSPSPLGVVNAFNTPFHKAEMLSRKGMPGYKRVFERLQLYLNDISGFATKAEQLAPQIFRELKGITPKEFRQYFKGAADSKDIDAIGPWLNHGTLYGGGNPLEGVTWTDDELAGKADMKRPIPRELKPLTKEQIPLYRQARAAIDQSLETSGKAVIHRHVNKYGITFDRDMSLPDVVEIVREQLGEKIDAMKLNIDEATEKADEAFRQSETFGEAANSDRKNREARLAADNAKAAYDRAQSRLDKLQGDIATMEALRGDTVAESERKAEDDEKENPGTIKAIADHAQALIDHGYMPLKRFGQKTVTALDKDGNTRFFGAYDGTPLVPGSANAEMMRVAEEVRALHPEWTVKVGTRSEKAWKMYQGLSLDALENFLDFLDPDTKAELERDATIQAYLKNAVNDRSVLKQLIHRKGTPGFSTDVPRILASFVTSSARNASGLYHIAEAKRLVGEMTQKNGEQGVVQDEAADLVDYVTKPGEEAAVLRSFLFFNFLGGSIAAAAINLTQTVMVTAPYLSQYSGIGKLTTAIGRAAKLAVGDPAVMEGAMGKDLKRAELEGVTAPQQIYHLMAMASNNPFSSDRRFRTAMAVWNGMFGAAEVFNRRIAFIAAHDIYESMTAAERAATGFDSAYDFAKASVDQTQFIYNKGNRPNLAQGAVGATIFTFKTFSISWLELLRRMPPQQQLMMLGLLVLMAGAEGLPFAEDLEDVVDTLGQWLGFTTNTGKWTGKTIGNTLGKEFERPILKGLGGMLPLDLHSRLGMQNLLPGTSFFKPSEVDKTRDVAEAFGPAGGLMQNFSQALQLMARGKWDRAAVMAAPKAARDAYNGAHIAVTGESLDTKGRLAMKDMTAVEGFGKAIGFNPQRAAIEGETKRKLMLDKNLRTVRMDDIASDWADGILRKDTEKQKEARERFREWNKNNPELRINGNQMLRSVQERVKAARRTAEQRFLKSVPKALRPEARQAFQN